MSKFLLSFMILAGLCTQGFTREADVPRGRDVFIDPRNAWQSSPEFRASLEEVKRDFEIWKIDRGIFPSFDELDSQRQHQDEEIGGENYLMGGLFLGGFAFGSYLLYSRLI